MESFCESVNVSVINLHKLTGMALVIGRSKCDSKRAVVPNSVQNCLTDFYNSKSLSAFELSYESTMTYELFKLI